MRIDILAESFHEAVEFSFTCITSHKEAGANWPGKRNILSVVEHIDKPVSLSLAIYYANLAQEIFGMPAMHINRIIVKEEQDLFDNFLAKLN